MTVASPPAGVSFMQRHDPTADHRCRYCGHSIVWTDSGWTHDEWGAPTCGAVELGRALAEATQLVADEGDTPPPLFDRALWRFALVLFALVFGIAVGAQAGARNGSPGPGGTAVVSTGAAPPSCVAAIEGYRTAFSRVSAAVAAVDQHDDAAYRASMADLDRMAGTIRAEADACEAAK